MNFHTHTSKLCNVPGCCNPLPPDADYHTCRDVTGYACTAELQNKRYNLEAWLRRQNIQRRADGLLLATVNSDVPVDSRLDSWFAAGE